MALATPVEQAESAWTRACACKAPTSQGQAPQVRPLIGQILEGSFSAVSKPNFAIKYAFDSSRRDLLHNTLLCTSRITIFAKILCVDLPKIVFLAARGGRGRGVAFSACSAPSCCCCLGFDYFRRGALPQKSARSRAARLAQLGRFWVGDACRDLAEFLDTFAGPQRASAFACVSVPAGCRGVVTP